MKLKVSLRFSSDGKVPVGMLMDYGRDSLFEYDDGFLSRGDVGGGVFRHAAL